MFLALGASLAQAPLAAPLPLRWRPRAAQLLAHCESVPRSEGQNEVREQLGTFTVGSADGRARLRRRVLTRRRKRRLTGTMSAVAPIAGASAIVPVVYGIATGDNPSGLQLAGMAAAIAGVALAAREQQPGGRRLAAGVGLALLAAVGFGFYFPPMHAAGAADPWWSAVVFRLTATLVVLAAVAVRRPPVRLVRWPLVI